MTEFILILPYWLWVTIIAAILLPVAVLMANLTRNDSPEIPIGTKFLIFFLILIVVSLVYFSDFYERTELESVKLGASDYKIRQHEMWARDSVSFLSERLSARKAMQEKVREDTLSYSPVVIKTIELLENQIRDYEFRIFALKDALIDSNVRQGITSKADAQVQRKDYGIILRRGTGIVEINPDDMSIKSIFKGTSASDAGLAEGDIITEIIRPDENDWKTMESSDIDSITSSFLYRGYMYLRIKPRDGRKIGKIGLHLQHSEYAGIPAITILEVLKNKPAEMAGLKVGDQIVKVNDSAILFYSDFYNHFLNLATIESTKLGIIRDELEMDIIVKNYFLREKEYEVLLEIRGIPYMLDETYFEWVRITEGLKFALDLMKWKQQRIYFLGKVSELDPGGDKSKEIDKLILEAKKTADRSIQLFKLGESDE